MEMRLYRVVCIALYIKCINDQLLFHYASAMLACLHVSIIHKYVYTFIITPTWFCML